MRILLIILILAIKLTNVSAQGLLTPSQFLSYELGTRFTFHSDIERYVDYIAQHKPSTFKKINYGKSEEGRNLFVVMYGSEANIKSSESIRINHLRSLHLQAGNDLPEETLITWYSFNVHGDEASSAETALKLLHHLAVNNPDENGIFLIDPCLNPDGRERYVQWFQASVFKNAIPKTPSWPAGRFNHYLSDLNRDWAWQIQKESQQRLKLYNDWMPHVHADFHEMETFKSYFFPPSAEPLHSEVSVVQKNILNEIGSGLEAFFKKKGWDYFTAKEFDLLYPSYGDTYATFNGGIGLTLEQGGGSMAGTLLIKENGDTLTLTSRIEKHFEVAKKLNTIILNHKDQIIKNQQDYHLIPEKKGAGPFGTYVIKNNNPAQIQVLKAYLSNLEIDFQITQSQQSLEGFNFKNHKYENVEITKGDILISTYQPKGHLVSILFEPNTAMDEVKTYDISAWSIPFLHHLECYGVKKQYKDTTIFSVHNILERDEGIGFSIEWNSASSVKFLAKALKLNTEISVHPNNPYPVILFSEVQNLAYLPLLNYADSLNLKVKFYDKKTLKSLKNTETLAIQSPRIGLVQGSMVSESDLGDLIFYFDKYLSIPFELIWEEDIKSLELTEYDILIFADGKYKKPTLDEDKFKHWLADGGKLILLKGALSIIDEINNGLLVKKNLDEILYSKSKGEPSNLVQGVIFNATLNERSPLRFGLNDGFNFLFEDMPIYSSLDSKIINSSTIGMNNHLSGFIGCNARNYMEDTFVLGTYHFGNGVVYQMAFNPLFRGILEDGKILMGNTLFMPGK
jgi:hypothetical protein